MSYTYLKQYLKKSHADFWHILKQCGIKDLIKNNATLLIPTATTIAELTKLIDNDNFGEATSILKAHIFKTVFKTTEDLKNLTAVANACYKQLVVKKINNDSVDIDAGVIAPDTKYKPVDVCDLKNNTSVWIVTSGKVNTDTKVIASHNKTRTNIQRGSCDASFAALHYLRDNLFKWYGSNGFSVTDKFMEIFCKVLYIIEHEQKYRTIYLQCKSFFTGIAILDIIFVFYNNVLVSYKDLNDIIQATHTYDFSGLHISNTSTCYMYYIKFCQTKVAAAEGLLLNDKAAVHKLICTIPLPDTMAVVETYKSLISSMLAKNALPNMESSGILFEPEVYNQLKSKENLLMSIFEIQFLLYKLLLNSHDIGKTIFNMFIVTFRHFTNDKKNTVLQHIKDLQLFDSIQDQIKFVSEVIQFIFKPFSDAEIYSLNVTKFKEIEQLVFPIRQPSY